MQIDNFLCKISHSIMNHLREAGKYVHYSEFSVQPLDCNNSFVPVKTSTKIFQTQNLSAF